MELEAPSLPALDLGDALPAMQSRWVRARAWAGANRTLVVGMGMVIALIVVALAGPYFTKYDPSNGNIEQSLIGPSRAFLFGTDANGRDMFTRIIYGARPALAVSMGCVGFSLALGSVLGLIAAYVGGITGTVIMRVLDVVISFPYIVLVIAVLAVLGPGQFSVAVAIAVVDWTAYGRIMYGQVLSVREREYVEACRAVGVPAPRIMLRHILPNVITPSLVYATLDISQVILLISALSFLGLGAQPPAADWGTMINDGQTYIQTNWWISTFPGLAIMLTGTSFALLGDGLADALDRRR